MRKEDVKPQAIAILSPDIVTIYKNQSVVIPVTVQNNWNSSLKGIYLNASTAVEGMQLRYSKDFFEELLPGEVRNVTLTVGNYRLGQDYKIRLFANVTDPDTSDDAVVILNSIEQSNEGDDVETKVTFAQDLLNENPECLELNELLAKAKEAMTAGSRNEATLMVDGVIEGCKYLVSLSKKTVQKPETIVTKVLKKENTKYLVVFLASAMLVTTVVLTARRHSANKKKQEDAQKKKEETVVPYWPGQR